MALLRAPSDNYATNYSSDVLNTHFLGYPEAVVQVLVTGTGTATVQGRSEEGAPWYDIKAYTASDADQIVLMRQMRVVTTSVAGGDVKVWVNEK